MRLIVTRPEPDASRTAEALVGLGHQPILSPMLDLHFDAAATLPEKPYQAVLATSGNAVRALAGHPQRVRLADLPMLAVGDQTALEGRRAGFAVARSAGGALGDLVRLASRDLDGRGGPLLYLAGDVQAGDLAALLVAEGFQVDTVVIYRTEARKRLTLPAEAALRSGAADGVLVFSRRSAEAFSQAVTAANLAPLPDRVACFCLSANVAEPLRAVAPGPVLVAERPEQLSVFALLENYATSTR